MGHLIRVLVVDDSAYVRKVIKQMLQRSPFLEVVGSARDGEGDHRLGAETSGDHLPNVEEQLGIRGRGVLHTPRFITPVALEGKEEVQRLRKKFDSDLQVQTA